MRVEKVTSILIKYKWKTGPMMTVSPRKQPMNLSAKEVMITLTPTRKERRPWAIRKVPKWR